MRYTSHDFAVRTSYRRLWDGRKQAFERTSKPDEQARFAAEVFYHENERDRMLNFQRIAQLHIAKSERDSARSSYEQALEIARYFLQYYPESELSAADMAMNLYSLADLALEEAQFEPAAEHYAEGLKLVLAAAEKQPTPRLATLAIAGHLGVARASARLFRLREAIQHCASAVKDLRESAQRDPGDLSLQWHFLSANDEAADLFGLVHMRDGIQGAIQCYDNSLNTCLTMLGTGSRMQPAQVRNPPHRHDLFDYSDFRGSPRTWGRLTLASEPRSTN